MKRFYILGLIVLAFGLFMYSSNNDSAKKEAIEQAKNYSPMGICTASITPATHTETGAKYNFSTGCLAPGWVAD